MTASDGKLSKLELYVQVVKKISGGTKLRLPNPFNPFPRPRPLTLPGVTSYQTPPITQKILPMKENITTTYLTPSPPYDKRYNYVPPSIIQEDKEKIPDAPLTATSSEIPPDQKVKQAPDLTVTFVAVVGSVFAIFLAVGIIALMFRKKICLGRSKDVKEDMVSLIEIKDFYVSECYLLRGKNHLPTS